jgi:hypothetical protein
VAAGPLDLGALVRRSPRRAGVWRPRRTEWRTPPPPQQLDRLGRKLARVDCGHPRQPIRLPLANYGHGEDGPDASLRARVPAEPTCVGTRHRLCRRTWTGSSVMAFAEHAFPCPGCTCGSAGLVRGSAVSVATGGRTLRYPPRTRTPRRRPVPRAGAARDTMVVSTVWRSSVELTARPTSPGLGALGPRG